MISEMMLDARAKKQTNIFCFFCDEVKLFAVI